MVLNRKLQFNKVLILLPEHSIIFEFSMMRTLLISTLVFFAFDFVDAQTPKIKIGAGFGHMYDMYEGPLKKTDGTGNVTYEITDIDLKGLNGKYTQFDVGASLLAALEINKIMAMTFTLTNASMTAQFDNQYAKTKLNLVNFGVRRYLKPPIFRRKIQAYPFFQVGLGLTHFDAQRYFIKDEGLFSKTNGVAFSNSVTTGCLFTLSRKISVDVAPNFIINHSDAIDGYSNKGSDIMMQTSIGILFNLN